MSFSIPRTAFAAATMLLGGGGLLAGQQTAPPCQAAEFHQFDFWIGKWEVTGANGRIAGHNEIVPFAGGCALLENWAGSGGGTGKSINGYKAGAQRWEQYWVGNGGFTLNLTGGIVEGKMILEGGERPAQGGQMVVDRITWTPVSADEVRQVWEVSADKGATWRKLFDGTYRRMKED